MVAARLNLVGPMRADGTPGGTRCGANCRTPTGNMAHCTVCHGTFSGVTYFDEHRRDGWCLNPVAIGLVLDDGLWATPEGHAARAVAAERMAVARAGKVTQEPLW